MNEEECMHPEDWHWIERWADHGAGTVRVDNVCTNCGEVMATRTEPLSDEERDWNDRADALRKAAPHLSAAQRHRLLVRGMAVVP